MSRTSESSGAFSPKRTFCVRVFDAGEFFARSGDSSFFPPAKKIYAPPMTIRAMTPIPAFFIIVEDPIKLEFVSIIMAYGNARISREKSEARGGISRYVDK